jgi:hypothetical protein
MPSLNYDDNKSRGRKNCRKFVSSSCALATLIPNVRGLQRTRGMEAAQTFEQISLSPIEWRTRKDDGVGINEQRFH